MVTSVQREMELLRCLYHELSVYHLLSELKTIDLDKVEELMKQVERARDTLSGQPQPTTPKNVLRVDFSNRKRDDNYER